MAIEALHFKDIFGANLVNRLIVQFLRLSELSKVECSGRSSREVLLAGPSWGQSVCRDLLSQFRVPVPPETSRRDIRALVTDLRAASVALDGQPVTLGSFGFARDLAEAIAHARGAKAFHLACSGGFAEIVIARFRRKDGGAIPTGPDARASTWEFGSSVVAIVSPGGALKVWELTLIWQAGTILVSSQCLGSDESPRHDPGVLLDLHAVSDDLVLRSHDLHLRAGTALVKAHGSAPAPGQRQVAPAALADGLLCVLLVRNKPRKQQRRRVANPKFMR